MCIRDRHTCMGVRDISATVGVGNMQQQVLKNMWCNLVELMPNRIKEVVKIRGGHISY